MSVDLEGIATHGSDEDVLARGRMLGIFSALDVEFARRLAALYGEAEPVVLWALALVCRQEAGGHVCADLVRLEEAGLVAEHEGLVRRFEARVGSESLDAWIADLEASPLVGRFDSFEEDEPRPLVLDSSHRLYLRRCFEDQRRLAGFVRDRVQRTDFAVDWSTAEERIARIAPSASEGIDWTHAALRCGLARPLSVVTGGPGTGKTTMVARLIALLIEESLARGESPPSVRLLAPTGKAAAAMTASFARGRGTLDVSSEVRGRLPTAAETIHRALYRQTRRDAFGRPERLWLDEDVVVIDEASMVDLSLMTRLFEACERVGRVVLLGDPDQLASVDAGAVLTELCRATTSRPGHPTSSELEAKGVPVRGEPTLGDSFVTLRVSHRFAAGGAIGQLAEAIREGNAERVLALLDDPDLPEIERCDVESVDAVRARLAEASRDVERSIREAGDPEAKLARMAGYRVLCAHRRGPLGVEALCAVLDEALAFERQTTSRTGWWLGRMLLVTHNAPDQDLWNGDVGLVEQTDAGLRALFPDGAGGVRTLSAGRLPAHESAIAMSIHKSQGSEFDKVDLVLGAKASRLMTRELLYTGVTRAREGLRIHASAEAIRDALDRRVERDSGLAELLRPEERD